MTTSAVLWEQTNLDRVRYFSRQLITVEDMLAEQGYFREKLRRHNRYLHGWGVVCGCEVVAAPETNHPWRVQICPGYVVTPMGDEIYIPPTSKMFFDFTRGPSQAYDPCEHVVPCPPSNRVKPESESKTVYLAVCYTECHVRPLRIHPAGCGCDDAACEYSRIREGFEFIQLWDLPESHKLADQGEEALCKKFQDATESETSRAIRNYGNGSKVKGFVPDCPESVEDDCVVLAQVTLPEKKTDNLDPDQITYEGRRVLYSTRTLQALCNCMPQTPQIRISIQPETAQLRPKATKQFTAKVTGSSNTAVTWSVQEPGGTISTAGLYAAPTAEGTYHVIAASQADSTKTATATVTVKAEPITISISPEAVTLTVGGTEEFEAILTGENPGPVIWSLEENRGSIEVSDDGLKGKYTAPDTPGTYHIKIAIQADPLKFARATITVVPKPISVSIEPTTVSLISPAEQSFKATVSGTEDQAVTWSVEENNGGTITSDGVYKTPPPPSSSSGSYTYHVVATSQADSTKFAKATVNVSVIA